MSTKIVIDNQKDTAKLVRIDSPGVPGDDCVNGHNQESRPISSRGSVPNQSQSYRSERTVDRLNKLQREDFYNGQDSPSAFVFNELEGCMRQQFDKTDGSVIFITENPRNGIEVGSDGSVFMYCRSCPDSDIHG
ncbi:unnamed protein product [Calicophoron daubneyi]|uniref:Uncharacterized protein n=1 Tax=Calicophoron daubneyi TaxID=300641 RepID=A0AAV2TTN1_CALDB